MRLLCLHPWGTSGPIFEKQMAALCAMLGNSHDYVYINGPVTCRRARDLPSFVNGPFYCWHEGLVTSQVQTAHALITEVIEEEGPFDGVLGFSQGASLALSILLHHEVNHSHTPPPFRFAVFFCSNVVVSPDISFNRGMIAKYSRYYKSPQAAVTMLPLDNSKNPANDDDKEMDLSETGFTETQGIKMTKKKTAPKHRVQLLLPGRKEALVDEIVDLIRELQGNTPGRTNVTGEDSNYAWPKDGTIDDFPRLMHPLTMPQRVSIPTVHVLSQSDAIARQSELAVRLCEKKNTKVVQIKGGHRMPVALVDLRAVVAAVEWAMQRSQHA